MKRGIGMKMISFSYGCLADKIEDQAISQGFTLGKDAKKYERCREALITLKFGIDVPESIYERLIRRLHDRVVKHLNPVSQKVVKQRRKKRQYDER